MKTNFIEGIKRTIFWKDNKAFGVYTKLFIAIFSAFLSLPLMNRLKSFSGFEEISSITIGILIYKYLLPKFNKDSLSVWTLIYGYLAQILLILPSGRNSLSTNINGNSN